jgi:hypothetical protein
MENLKFALKTIQSDVKVLSEKNIELNLKIEKLLNIFEANGISNGTTMLPP